VRTQVGIVGAGPAGLLLGHALRQAGIDVLILERQSQAHVEGRIRAGVLESVTTNLMDRLGLGGRMHAEGLVERGFNIADGRQLVRIDLEAITGRHMLVYGQTEITSDLIAAAPERGLEIIWEAQDVALQDVGGNPRLTWAGGAIDCDFIAGCDGFHGPSRHSIPDATTYEKAYPFGWLGILADVPPCYGELIYSNHENGFALASMRSATRSRYYIQVPLDDSVEAWPDDRFWAEFATRIPPEAAAGLVIGPSIEKSIAPLRSFVSTPMRHGRLFVAGDAAHIVPPTGAKGLNLAASDVFYLASALTAWYVDQDETGLDAYSDRALARVWKAERFSWYLTSLMHRFPDTGTFERAMQVAELDYIAGSAAMQTAIAENYVGLPL
jgi:p-hydroxybenzoate 3-monooxygenase